MLQVGDRVNIIGDSFFGPTKEYEVCGVSGDPWYDSRGYIHPELGVTVIEPGQDYSDGIWVFKDKVKVILPKEPTWEL